MKITKDEAIKLINQHSVFKAVSVNALNDKKSASKTIEKMLDNGTTILVMK